MSDFCRVANVAIPLVLDQTFIPPDLDKALEYYPNFIRTSGFDWPIQAYLCAIMKEIDKKKPNGYTGNVALGEYLTHFGMQHFGEMMGVE